MKYQFSKKTDLPFDSTVEKVKEELKKEGFGVLTTINMKDTLKQKINVDIKDYVILGACNPGFAWGALQEEDKIGVFLPCNVVVHQLENDKVEVTIANPEEMMSHVKNDKLDKLAGEVKESLKRVLADL